MSAATVQLILALIPMAENLIFEIGGQILKLNTSELTKDELIKALEGSRYDTWPDLQFISKKPE